MTRPKPCTRPPSTRRLAIPMGLLTLLFAGRVLGQAIQRWQPQSFLPPFGAFQGSGLSYPILLSSQLVILALMVRGTWRAQTATCRASPRTAKTLTVVGGVYLAGSIARIVVGLAIASAPAWFSTWIPASFHLVLAAFVLTLAACFRSMTNHPEHQQ